MAAARYKILHGAFRRADGSILPAGEVITLTPDIAGRFGPDLERIVDAPAPDDAQPIDDAPESAPE